MKRSNLFGYLLVTCLLTAAPLLASNEHTTFTGGIGAFNPCNGTLVTAFGPVDIVVETNTSSDTRHVTVHHLFRADGSATNGDSYGMSFMANSNFDAVASFYDLFYHAVLVGKGSAPNFSIEGNIRVFVNPEGKATGSIITTLSSSCTQ